MTNTKTTLIPILKEGNNYTAATWAALKVIMPVCRGEYDYETYQSDEDLSLFDWICVIAILLVFIGFALSCYAFGGGVFGLEVGFKLIEDAYPIHCFLGKLGM